MIYIYIYIHNFELHVDRHFCFDVKFWCQTSLDVFHNSFGFEVVFSSIYTSNELKKYIHVKDASFGCSLN